MSQGPVTGDPLELEELEVRLELEVELVLELEGLVDTLLPEVELEDLDVIPAPDVLPSLEFELVEDGLDELVGDELVGLEVEVDEVDPPPPSEPPELQLTAPTPPRTRDAVNAIGTARVLITNAVAREAAFRW